MPEKENMGITFAQRLKECRKNAGYKQWQVADLLNINRTTYTKYETGVSEPSQEVLRKIIEIFGIDYNMLFGSSDALDVGVAENPLTVFRLVEEEKELVSLFREMDKQEQLELIKIAKMMSSDKKEE